MGMFLRVVGVKLVLFWATAMLWLRGPVGVEEGEVVVVVLVDGEASISVSVERSVSSDVAVAVLRVEGPETEGA